MIGGDTEPNEGSPADERRRAEQAELDALDERGRQMSERYGRADTRPRFAAVGHAEGKRRRRR